MKFVITGDWSNIEINNALITARGGSKSMYGKHNKSLTIPARKTIVRETKETPDGAISSVSSEKECHQMRNIRALIKSCSQIEYP